MVHIGRFKVQTHLLMLFCYWHKMEGLWLSTSLIKPIVELMKFRWDWFECCPHWKVQGSNLLQLPCFTFLIFNGSYPLQSSWYSGETVHGFGAWCTLEGSRFKTTHWCSFANDIKWRVSGGLPHWSNQYWSSQSSSETVVWVDGVHWKVQGSNPLTETLLLLTKNRKSLVVYLTGQIISGAHKVIYISIHLSIYLSIYIYIDPSIYISICLQKFVRFGWMVHTGRFKVQTLSLILFCYWHKVESL